MAKLWPPAPSGETEFSMREKARLRVEESILVPPVDVQLHLIRLFFTYVNPSLPALDEDTFMEQYHADVSLSESAIPRPSGTDPRPAVEPERMQKMSKLLLFSVFAFAAQYWDTIQAEQYAASARRLLDIVCHESRTSTVQALVLLGVREFGIAWKRAGCMSVWPHEWYDSQRTRGFVAQFE